MAIKETDMFFSVKVPLKIDGKDFHTCICYKITDTLKSTVEKLAAEGKAVIYDKQRFFCNGKLVEKKPIEEETIVEEPTVEEQTIEEPISEETIEEETIVEEPIVEESTIEEPVAEEPITEEPIITEVQTSEEQPTDEPVVEKQEETEKYVSTEEKKVKNTNRILWGVIVVLVLIILLGVYWMFLRPSDVPEVTPLPPVQEEVTIPVPVEEKQPEDTIETVKFIQLSAEELRKEHVPSFADTLDYQIIGTQEEYTLQKGETIIRASVKVFGTKKYWPYIVKHNLDVLPDPDNIPAGVKIKIPVLTPKK